MAFRRSGTNFVRGTIVPGKCYQVKLETKFDSKQHGRLCNTSTCTKLGRDEYNAAMAERAGFLKEHENELFGMDVTMTAKSRKTKQSTSSERVDEPVATIDPTLLTKRKLPAESMHVNLRLTGESVQIYRYLEGRTPAITDSLRIRDCIRIAAFLCAMKQKDEPLMVEIDGRREDLLDYIGAFYPQTPMDTRRRADR